MTAEQTSDIAQAHLSRAMLARAEAYCSQNRVQFTPLRRRVLEILLAERKALGAYEVLDRLRADGLGTQPPVAYRPLDFLVKHGLAHKIERLNAYIACTLPCETHHPAFMICRICDSVSEAATTPAKGTLGLAARAAGFRIEQTVVEAIGICPLCVDQETAERR